MARIRVHGCRMRRAEERIPVFADMDEAAADISSHDPGRFSCRTLRRCLFRSQGTAGLASLTGASDGTAARKPFPGTAALVVPSFFPSDSFPASSATRTPFSRRRSSRTVRLGNRLADEPALPFRRVGSRPRCRRARSLRTAARPDGANGDSRFRPLSFRRRERRRDIGLRPCANRFLRRGLPNHRVQGRNRAAQPAATGNSVVPAVGSLGTRPLQWDLETAGWREVFWLTGATRLAALAAIVPERNAETRGGGASSVSIYRDAILRSGDSCPWRP